MENKAEELMEKMGIGGLSRRRITEVSGGQLQRACICRSMMNQSKILFADEPTGALNQRSAEEVMDEFTRLNEEGTTILMVTHDNKIASKCSRVLYILDGSIVGEFINEKSDNKERETELKEWLSKMGC